MTDLIFQLLLYHPYYLYLKLQDLFKKDHIEENSPTYIFFNLIPIGISSFITCSVAIIKFKKYQDGKYAI